VIVIRAPKIDVELACAGQPMSDSDGDRVAADGLAFDLPMGKRYEDAGLGLELLVTSAGSGPLSVDGVPLTIRAPRSLPASD
jgi:hypothetical protein